MAFFFFYLFAFVHGIVYKWCMLQKPTFTFFICISKLAKYTSLKIKKLLKSIVKKTSRVKLGYSNCRVFLLLYGLIFVCAGAGQCLQYPGRCPELWRHRVLGCRHGASNRQKQHLQCSCARERWGWWGRGEEGEVKEIEFGSGMAPDLTCLWLCNLYLKVKKCFFSQIFLKEKKEKYI